MAMSKIMADKECAATKAAQEKTMKWLSEKKYITQDQSLLKIFLENHQRIQHLHPLQKRKRESHMMNKMTNP
jgi:predicted metal-dependent HD superfamily phosphohydrolase